MSSERLQANHGDDDDDDVQYLSLDRLARYSGLSIGSLRRYLKDPVAPLPHFRVRGAGKQRGRVLVQRTAFDAWIKRFAPAGDTPPGPDVSWIRFDT